MIFKLGKKKKFYFFSTLAGTFFVVFIGIFAHLGMIFFSLGLIYFDPLYYQFSLFLFFGIIFFSLSYFIYLKRYKSALRGLSYEGFIASRNRLIVGLAGTINFYFLSCGFLLILLGVFNGFGFKFPTSDSKDMFLYATASETKILGVILGCVHIFGIFLFKTVLLYWRRVFLFAHQEFNKRRQTLENVRQKARTQI